MAGLIVLSLMAAPLGDARLSAPIPGERATAVSVSARATVRILPGARVSLSDKAVDQGYRLSSARITSEDGRQILAKLVEFQ